jgi:glucokinase
LNIKTKIQNDPNACALAEWRFGATRVYENVIFLTFGTGMGAGLILDGKLYSGTSNMAGEVGHIRFDTNGPVGYGKAGSFEGFCSGAGIAQIARIKVMEQMQIGEKVSFCNSMDSLDRLNAKIVSDAAKKGDKLTKEIYLICAEYFGRGLAILIDILNPEIIVVGSVFTRSTDLLYPIAIKVIEREALVRSRKVCKLVSAELGKSIGDFASLAVAAEEICT